MSAVATGPGPKETRASGQGQSAAQEDGRRLVAAGRRTWRFAVLNGLLICGIVCLPLAATRFGDASVAAPIAQLNFVLASALAPLYHRDSFRVRKVAALVAAALCVVALSMS